MTVSGTSGLPTAPKRMASCLRSSVPAIVGHDPAGLSCSKRSSRGDDSRRRAVCFELRAASATRMA